MTGNTGQTDAQIHAEMADTRTWLRAKLVELIKQRQAREPQQAKIKTLCPACFGGRVVHHSPDCEAS